MSESLRAAPVRPSAAVCRAIEIIEAESAYSQHVCAPAHEAARLGLAAERMGSAAVILTRNSKNTMYNKLAALGQASPATERQIDRFIDLARQHRVKKISVPLGRRLGCELFTSETAPPLARMPLVSFRNLQRQGFELAYLRYAWNLEI